MDKSGTLDRTDLALLRLLQVDSWRTYEELAELLLADKIGIDQATVGKRIKALRDAGFILGFQAVLNREKLELIQSILVLVRLENHRPETSDAFEATINREFPNVIESMRCSGSWDYLLKIVGKDLLACDLVTGKLRRLPQVTMTREHPIKGEKFSALPLPFDPIRK